MSVVTVEEVKQRLGKASAADDDEIQDMIDRAEAEYVRLIGALAGSVTERHHGGGSRVVLRNPNATAVTAAAYSDGTAIAEDDLEIENGIVYWGYNTDGAFTSGTRNVSITYTVAASPAHLERIVADVAGYFSASQRGGYGGRPDFDAVDEAIAYAPMELFPRIKALAASYPTVA